MDDKEYFTLTGLPRVSVIMPLYNGASTVQRAIESVLRQDFASWELIVVDDCSTDGSSDLVQQIITSDSSGAIRLCRSENNGGPGAARNLGIELAVGEFIVFLDCDDELLPSCLSTLTSRTGDSIDVVVASHLARLESGQSEARPDRKPGLHGGTEVLNFAMQGQLWNYLHAKIYRKSLFDVLRFPVGLVRYEDLVFNACAYSYSSQVLIIESPVYLYYVQSQSLTWSQRPSLEYVKGTMSGLQKGLNPLALARVDPRSWDCVAAFLDVMTYSGGLFAPDSEEANREILAHLQAELPVRALLSVVRLWPKIGVSAILLRTFPTAYGVLYRWHVRRTFGLG